MKVQGALLRAFRTALQAFVGAAAAAQVAPVASLADVKGVASTLGFAAVIGLSAGVVSLAQNVAEDNGSLTGQK